MALSNAERQKAYRERQKAKKSKEQAMFASSVPGEYIAYTETRPGHFVANILTDGEVKTDPESGMQAPISPAPESEIGRQVPPPCVVEGNPDDLPPVKIEPEMLTYFDVYKRRHDGMFK